jgi:hypothetical protein
VYVITFLTSARLNICSALGQNLNLSFVLWLLIAEKETTLEQNPHFYDDLSEVEQEHFTRQSLPLDRQLGAFVKNPHIYVLVDRQHHIHVKYAGGEKVYGNIWESKRKKIVLKGAIALMLCIP